MATLQSVSHVSVFVKNQKRAKDFYTRKLGLTVREYWPDWNYLSVGTTKDGPDASLTIWEPKTWGIPKSKAKKLVGQIAGIGFSTPSMAALTKRLARAKVKFVVAEDEGPGPLARVWDQDGNVLFVWEDKRARANGGRLGKLDFVTIASRDAKRLGKFYTGILGFREKRSGPYKEYRLTPKGTALMPFTVKRSNYPKVSDYKNDLGAIGETTYMMLMTSDLEALQAQFLKKKVKFRSRAEVKDWGGMEAEILDTDRNSYQVVQWNA